MALTDADAMDAAVFLLSADASGSVHATEVWAGGAGVCVTMFTCSTQYDASVCTYTSEHTTSTATSGGTIANDGGIWGETVWTGTRRG